MDGSALFNKTLNKDIPIPLYLQLKEFLMELITNHGDQAFLLPSEAQLCEHFQISRSTVRQTMGELTSEGLISRQKGRGTVTLPQKINQNFLYVLESFNEEMKGKGLIPHTKVLSCSLEKASPAVAHVLDLPENDQIIQLVRLRGVDNEPMVLVITCLPASRYGLESIINEDFSQVSLYKVMEEKYLVSIVSTRRTIEVKIAGDFESKHLNIPIHSPLQYIETVACTDGGVPVEFSRASYRGDLSRFMIEVKRKRI
ncbi:transcriptional regulator, GntR family with UTRA sensor domain [Parasphaerochaeta coccoides DSM 17374]|uniref:Transcriptional regulator, GntR family with UTRA sensor domain n=2 Tax=Parasphaerochaeta TaxID=3062336 RepID=F4GI95_PARC1|nr:transcriptional regulator, GntR family with UTRA sensor domain [Parasphaerochaeta coccoides DSM 17374]